MEAYIGIDVGKSNLDVHVNGQDINTANSDTAIKKLIKRFKKEESNGLTIKLIICEATGGYEELLVNLLAESGYPIHVAHPNKVRYFAKSQGQLAKTDRIDARILSEYGRLSQLQSNHKPVSAEQVELRSLLQRRRQLLDEKVRESNRLDKPITNACRHSIKSHIKWIEKEVKQIEKATKEQVEENQSLKEAIALLESIPGVGFLTAATVLTGLPELGELGDKELSALVGVAPMNADSGKYQGKRSIKGGRRVIREILYMATIASLRCNKVIKDYYHRLRAKGKPGKVAIVAGMHKLLRIINSVFKRQSPWEEELSLAGKKSQVF
jgi:transposase